MLSVRDIMQRDVITVHMEDSARTLARILADAEISGVPVLDQRDKVVGVVSSTDLVRLAAEEADVNLSAVALRPDIDRGAESSEDDRTEPDPYGFFLPEDSPQGMQLLEQFPETSFDTVTVSDLMTPVTFSVEPGLPVPELCSYLLRGRIHRALVVEGGELVGIVTSQDVLKAVAEARVQI
jgi:CBS domain-containing protein